MKLAGKRVLLTGASGAIGGALARELLARGAQLGLVGRRRAVLEQAAAAGVRAGGAAIAIAADLTRGEDRERAVRRMRETYGGIDVLINDAGAMDFTDFALQDPQRIERIMELNALAPMQLAHAVLPAMLARGTGHIVNIGSLFGCLGYAYFAVYSASKCALRGFSAALRRELEGTGVGITYVAPRRVNDGQNAAAVYRMAGRGRMALDEPATVARRILGAVESERAETFPGFPESLLIRIDALWPWAVDRALRKRNRLMRDHAQPGGGEAVEDPSGRRR